MQFTKVLLAAAAFAVANAQVEFTMGSSFFAATYTAGVTSMNLTWDLNSGPVTLKLKNGPKTALNTVSTIATGVSGNSYPYTPPSTLANGQYAFEIDDSSSNIINYSAYFTLTGGSGVASNSTTSASSSGSSSSASSSPTSSASNTKTTTSATKSSATSATNSPTSSTTTPNTNSAISISSPLALVLLAFVAMMTLN